MFVLVLLFCSPGESLFGHCDLLKYQTRLTVVIFNTGRRGESRVTNGLRIRVFG